MKPENVLLVSRDVNNLLEFSVMAPIKPTFPHRVLTPPPHTLYTQACLALPTPFVCAAGAAVHASYTHVVCMVCVFGPTYHTHHIHTTHVDKEIRLGRPCSKI